MATVAIIGGTGLSAIEGLQINRRAMVSTPYGEPSAALVYGQLSGTELVFLPRHGADHRIPPHRVNYRANIWALQQSGVRKVVAVAAVGAIRQVLTPGSLIIPDQVIDYTWGRAHTFFEEELDRVVHVDFTMPYCQELRDDLLRGAQLARLPVVSTGTYGATQGPRLESTAEIDRLERDGCDIVGMTGMPEAALARELGLCYATCAIVANAAAGRGEGPLSMSDIEANLKVGMEKFYRLLQALLSIL